MECQREGKFQAKFRAVLKRIEPPRNNFEENMNIHRLKNAAKTIVVIVL